jgi:hypothetical protein
VKSMADCAPLARELVNRLIDELQLGRVSMKEVEEKVVEFVYRLGALMVEEVVEKIDEPTQENTIYVDGKLARYRETANLRLITRFGSQVERRRRRYYIEGQGGYCPLDEKLGVEGCAGFSPLMTYLQSLFGGSEAYGAASRRLSAALGFTVSATAVQHNSEMIGEQLAFRPFDLLDAKRQSKHCELMVVEVDGTTSPQIHQEAGITGRESLKQPTEYKECNLIAIEKRCGGKRIDRWTGGCYGPRKDFEHYAHQAGLRMGQLKADTVVFLADGAHNNWDLQATNFPDSVGILDFYHASEHLAAYCHLFDEESVAQESYRRLRECLYNGEILELLARLRAALPRTKDKQAALKEINYFRNNRERMHYEEYREKGYPIGSGMVEGSCKYVVCRRFKGSGMRWKRADNESVLKVRLAIINDTLHDHFRRKAMREIRYAA